MTRISRTRVPIVIAVALASCTMNDGPSKEDTQTTSTGVPAPDPTPDLTYTLREVTCSVAPPPRRHSQSTFFHLDEPVEVGGTMLDRGILMVGGIHQPGSGPEEVLDDAWVLNLNAFEPGGDDCQWILLTEDATPTEGVYGGALFANGLFGSFALVGGVHDLGTHRETRDDVYMIAPEDLGAQFQIQPTYAFPSYEFEYREITSPICSGLQPANCYEEDAYGACTGVVLDVKDIDPCTGLTVGPACFDDVWSPLYTGCQALGDNPGDLACVDPNYVPTTVTELGIYEGRDSWSFAAVVRGIAHFAAVEDPQGGARLYGGTSGCNDADHCSDWVDVALLDQEEDWSLSLVNSPVRIDLDLVRDGETVFQNGSAALSPGPSEWPHDSEPGFSRWGVAMMGADFTYPRFTSFDNAYEKFVGGTAYQKKRPMYEYQLVQTIANTCGVDEDAYLEGVFGRPPMSEFVHDYDGQNGLTVLDGGQKDTGHIGTFGEPTIFPAVTNVEPSAYLVAGGQGHTHQGGRTDVHVFFESGEVSVGSMSDARYGANAVFDPVGLRTFVFNGTSGDPAADLVIVSTEATVDGGTEVWADAVVDDPARPALFEWAYVDPGTGFTVDGEFMATMETHVEFTCGNDDADRVDWLNDDDCFIGVLNLSVPDSVHARWDEVTVELDHGGTTYDLGDYEIAPVGSGGDGWEPHSVWLPKTFFSGEEAVIRVSAPVDLASANPDHHPYRTRDDLGPWADHYVHGESACDGLEFLDIKGIPVAWPLSGSTYQPSPSINGYYWNHWLLRVTSPEAESGDAFTVFGPGIREQDCASSWTAEQSTAVPPGGEEHCFRSGWQMSSQGGRFVAIEGLESLGNAQTTHEFWVQSCIGPTARAEVDDLMLEVDHRMALVGASFGPELAPSHDVVFLPRFSPGAAVSEVGLTGAPVHLVFPFDEDGTLRRHMKTRDQIGAITVHEYAHDWVGVKRYTTDPSAMWLTEALPQLAMYIAYPAGGQGVWIGVEAMLDFASPSEETDLEPADATAEPTDLARYFVGSYTVAQFRAMWLNESVGGYSDAEMAAELVDQKIIDEWIDDTPWEYQPYTREHVEAFFDDSSSFYDEWVARGRVGTPLLGITDVSFDVPTETMEVELTQVQTTALGWPIFTDVPFVVYCRDTEAQGNGEPSFLECGGNDVQLWQAPQLHGDRQAGMSVESFPFNPDPARPPTASTATQSIGLLAADFLRPDFPRSQGAGWPVANPGDDLGPPDVYDEWERADLLRCASTSEPSCDPALEVDSDLDGWVDDADCEPQVSAAHPGVSDLGWSTGDPDLNCDRWPK